MEKHGYPTAVSDGAIRLQCLHPRDSFIVQAPAGSGKTSLLVQRYLALLGTVEHPEAILALTFTQKAAAEMRERVLAALHHADSPTNHTLAAHANRTAQLAARAIRQNARQQWNIVENPHRLRIMTFDAWCAEWVHRFPLASQLPAQWRTTNDPAPIYRKVIRQFIETSPGKPWEKSLTYFLLTLKNDATKIEDLLTDMLIQREQWLPYLMPFRARQNPLERPFAHALNQLNTHWTAWVDAHWRQWQQEWEKWGGDLLPLLAFMQTQQPALQDLSPETLVGAQAIARVLLTQSGEWRKKWTIAQGFPAPSGSKNPEEKSYWSQQKHAILQYIHRCETDPNASAWQHSLQHLLSLPDPELQSSEAELLNALCEILPILVAHLHAECSHTQTYDFTGIAQAASQLARTAQQATEDNSLSIGLWLASIQHWLIDEFQDTSLTQYHWLSDCLHSSAASHTTQEVARTVFLVGDPMQSIYRFRQAEVALFSRIQRNGLGPFRCKAVSLNQNFRSHPLIVEWVNTYFPGIFKQDFAYQPAVSSRACTGNFAPELAFWQLDTAESEIQAIVDAIQTWHSSQPQHGLRDLAVLVRTRLHAWPIVRALKASGIAYQAQGLDRLADVPPVHDLLSLLKALMDPSDKLAWLTVLRAPWCGIPLQDLHRLLDPASDAVPRTIPEILETTNCLAQAWQDPTTPQRLQHLQYGIQEARRTYPYRNNTAAWLEHAWRILCGPETVHPMYQKDVGTFFEILHAYTQTGDTVSLTNFEGFLTRATTHTQPDSAAPSVQILTIHQSKGLEFDTVILPACDRAVTAHDSKLLFWRHAMVPTHQEEVLLMAPYTPASSISAAKNSKWAYLQAWENAALEAEQRRLLYVAITRARNQLWAFRSSETQPKGSFAHHIPSSVWTPYRAMKELLSNPLPETELPQLRTYPRRVAVTVLQRANARTSACATRTTAHPSWFAPNASVYHREYGSCLHAVLEQAVGDPQLACAEQYVARWVQQSPLLYPKAREHTRILHHWIAQLQADPRSSWILQNYPESGTEHRVALGNCIYQIDRWFVDPKTHTTWIIDYKTSAWTGRALPEQLQQLQQYRNWFSQKGYAAIRMALWYLTVPHWEEIR